MWRKMCFSGLPPAAAVHAHGPPQREPRLQLHAPLQQDDRGRRRSQHGIHRGAR